MTMRTCRARVFDECNKVHAYTLQLAMLCCRADALRCAALCCAVLLCCCAAVHVLLCCAVLLLRCAALC